MNPFSSVQSLSYVRLFATPWTAGLPVRHQLLKFTQTHVHWVRDAIQPFHSLLSPSPPAFILSQNWSFPVSPFFASGGQGIGVSASASVLPVNIQDWFPLEWTGWISLQSKGLSSLLQHHSSKASILLHTAFFIVQLSHPYMTTGKTIALTRQTFVGKAVSLRTCYLNVFSQWKDVQILEHLVIPGELETGPGHTETEVWMTVSVSCITGFADSLCESGLVILIFVQLWVRWIVSTKRSLSRAQASRWPVSAPRSPGTLSICFLSGLKISPWISLSLLPRAVEEAHLLWSQLGTVQGCQMRSCVWSSVYLLNLLITAYSCLAVWKQPFDLTELGAASELGAA